VHGHRPACGPFDESCSFGSPPPSWQGADHPAALLVADRLFTVAEAPYARFL
jgi:hypothetical protein